MPAMQKKPSSYPDRETSPERGEWTITSLEGSFSILKQSPRSLLGGSLPNTNDTRKYLAKKSRKDYPNIPSGTTPSNYSRGLPHRYLDNSSPSLKARLSKCRNL